MDNMFESNKITSIAEMEKRRKEDYIRSIIYTILLGIFIIVDFWISINLIGVVIFLAMVSIKFQIEMRYWDLKKYILKNKRGEE